MLGTPNGVFDANEHVVANLPIQAGATREVTWSLTVGVVNETAQYNLRFRLVLAPDPAKNLLTVAAEYTILQV